MKNIFLAIVVLGLSVLVYAYLTRISEEHIEVDTARSALAASNQVVIPAKYNNGEAKVIEIIPDYTYSAVYSSAEKDQRQKMWQDLLESVYAQINCTGVGCIEYVLSASCNNKATTTIFLKRDGGDEDIRLYTDIERARSREFHLEYSC